MAPSTSPPPAPAAADQPPRTPRWVWVLVGLAVLAVLGVLVSHLLTGGGRGPGLH